MLYLNPAQHNGATLALGRERLEAMQVVPVPDPICRHPGSVADTTLSHVHRIGWLPEAGPRGHALPAALWTAKEIG